MLYKKRKESEIYAILSPRPAQSAGRGQRPEGEGANFDRHLVPYHGKQGESNLASSLFIYLYIYICTLHGPCDDGVRRLGAGKKTL